MELDELLEGVENADAIKAALAASAESIAKQKAEALAKDRTRVIRSEKKDMKDLLDQFRDEDGELLTPEGLAQLHELASEAKKARQDSETGQEKQERLKREWLGPVERERDEARELAERRLRGLEKYLVDQEMLEELGAQGVPSNKAVVLRSHLKSSGAFKVVEKDDGSYEAFEMIDGIAIPVRESVQRWAKTEEAKDWRTAPQMQGGGAEGGSKSSSSGDGPNYFKRDDPAFSLTKAGELLKSDPEKAARLAKAAGFDLSN